MAEATVRVHGPEPQERSSGPTASDERVVAKRQVLCERAGIVVLAVARGPGRHDLHLRTLQLMRTNRSAPLGPVIPELAYPDVGAAVAWLVDALGFVERVRIGPGHRAQLSFGEGSLIVADVGDGRSAPTGEESSQSVMLRVDDVAALCDRVRKHGGEIVREPHDFSYGERQCTIRDPAGHRWTLTQTLHDVAPEEWGGITVDAE